VTPPINDARNILELETPSMHRLVSMEDLVSTQEKAFEQLTKQDDLVRDSTSDPNWGQLETSFYKWPVIDIALKEKLLRF